MTIVMAPGVQQAIREHARSAYPREGCGVLIGGEDERVRWVERAIPAANADPDPERRYAIAPEEFLKLEKHAREHGLEVIGIYHSHPDGRSAPSASDAAEAWPHYTYVIVGVGHERVELPTAWRSVEGAFVAERTEPRP
jgi:proteasome lid subunit RPN8/RPN11